MSAGRARKSPETYVRRMYDHASELKTLVDSGEVTPELLGTSRVVQLATVKAIELVGEQAYQLRRLGYSLGPDIDLVVIENIRHRMVHDYEGTDWEVVQTAAFEDIPELVAALERVMLERGIDIP